MSGRVFVHLLGSGEVGMNRCCFCGLVAVLLEGSGWSCLECGAYVVLVGRGKDVVRWYSERKLVGWNDMVCPYGSIFVSPGREMPG